MATTTTETDTDFIIIDGDRIESPIVTPYEDGGVTGAQIRDGNREWILFADREDAGKAARAYWQAMAENDPVEFRIMVGEENLIKWAMGESAGPGSNKVTSLNDWLDLFLHVPEEHFAGYDGTEIDIYAGDVGQELIDELGFTPEVAYRHN